MKMYSNDSVTHEQVEAAASRAALEATSQLDLKQTRQIEQLRIWCACLTVAIAAQLAFLISIL